MAERKDIAITGAVALGAGLIAVFTDGWMVFGGGFVAAYAGLLSASLTGVYLAEEGRLGPDGGDLGGLSIMMGVLLAIPLLFVGTLLVWPFHWVWEKFFKKADQHV